MSEKKRIYKSLVESFTDMPGPRTMDQGPGSGEEFREKYLIPWLEKAREKGSILVVNLAGAYGLPVSFTEEAFGGLQRHYKRKGEDLRVWEHLIVESPDDLTAEDDIAYFLKNAYENEPVDQK